MRERARIGIAAERHQHPDELRADQRLQARVAACDRDRQTLFQQRDRIEQAALVRLGRAEIAEDRAFEIRVAGRARGIDRVAKIRRGRGRIAGAVVEARDIGQHRRFAATVAGLARELQRLLEMRTRCGELAALVFDGCDTDEELAHRERLILGGHFGERRIEMAFRRFEIALVIRDRCALAQRGDQQIAIAGLARRVDDFRRVVVALRFLAARALRNREPETRPGETRIVVEADFEIFLRAGMIAVQLRIEPARVGLGEERIFDAARSRVGQRRQIEPAPHARDRVDRERRRRGSVQRFASFGRTGRDEVDFELIQRTDAAQLARHEMRRAERAPRDIEIDVA